MAHETPESLLLVLSKGAGGSRLAVDLESFLLFNAEIDQDLDNLVERWADFATPSSMRGELAESRDLI
ncbi:MAG: hypothetical protein GY768_04495 [Planctomycetaceae bacterium]|nr:hypothetical protein [Planctomycetaceae bacterium]